VKLKRRTEDHLRHRSSEAGKARATPEETGVRLKRRTEDHLRLRRKGWRRWWASLLP